MTGLEALFGFIASVLTMGSVLILTGRYLGRKIDRKFDGWIEAVIENSSAMRSLTGRVASLEETIHNDNRNN